MHFMVTQGIRDRKTLRVNYPMANKRSPAGGVNRATQQGRSAARTASQQWLVGSRSDPTFYIRSPKQDARNRPNREVFMHFFGMEVTWK